MRESRHINLFSAGYCIIKASERLVFFYAFIKILKYEKMINKYICSFLWWQRNEPKKATADKILALKKIIISYIFVHFFSDKETNQRNHPLTHFLL